MKEIEKNDHHKIVAVELQAGTNMPKHLATSDARQKTKVTLPVYQ